MVEKGRQHILDSFKMFRRVSEKTYQLLSSLNYIKEDSLPMREGVWEIFAKKNAVSPYLIKTVETPVNKFIAIYQSVHPFVVYGSCENPDEVRKNLLRFTEDFIIQPPRVLGIPLQLTPENAQDYGYSRGFTLGLMLMIIDIVYTWSFKLKNGILSGLIDFIRLVYEGNQGLAIGVGFPLTGFYFILPLIVLPIAYGNWCVNRAVRIEERKLQSLPADFLGYEYGADAEKSLEEEFSTLLDESRKKAMFEEAQRRWNIGMNDFENVYERISDGFLTPESLHAFLRSLQAENPAVDLSEFLDMMIRYRKASPRLEMKISLENENQDGGTKPAD